MFLLNVDIRTVMESCSYLGHSGDTVLIPNLQLETKSERKQQEKITKRILFKILSKESRVAKNE